MKQLLTISLLMLSLAISAQDKVSVKKDGMTTTMDNGLVQITIGSNGRITNMTYRNGANVIGSTGVYFDFTSKQLGNKPLSPATATIVRQSDDLAEVVYANTSYAPHFRQGFILRRGVSGVYIYVMAEGNSDTEAMQVQEIRCCTRLASTFLNGYVDDSMRGTLPSNATMAALESGGKDNAGYVQDATYRLPDGSIYTKYNWAQYVVRDSLHGLMNSNTGVWNIPCSYEWMAGGPMKQELTVHATGKSPITIQMLHGEHFGTQAVSYTAGTRKLYGPFLIYLNGGTQAEMVADAKQMAHEQRQQWPFEWFENAEYPLQRSTVTGRINVTTGQRLDSIQVVLAQPDVELYRQNEGYMFWALTDAEGRFSIPHVRPGSYALRAYATAGDVTDELQVKDITVDGKGDCDLGTITWTPACYAYKLFQIGQNNRMSDGYRLSDTLRNYGLWTLPPASLTFKVGESREASDWWYAQTKTGTWTIEFESDRTYTGTAHLTASVAGAANKPKVAVAINGTTKATWSIADNDGSIYRSAVLGGRHYLLTCDFPASLIKQGTNRITLKLTQSGNGGIMYDCLKLEAGDQVTNGLAPITATPATAADDAVYNLRGQRIANSGSLTHSPLPHGIYIHRGRKVVR